MSANDVKVELRERLLSEHQSPVPVAFDYSRPTSDFYRVASSKGHIGKYKHIRATLDAAYHGTYSHERQALQDDLLDALLAGAGGGKDVPWIIFTAGAMGSGKSRTFDFLVEKRIIPLRELQILDSDVFKAALPEWHGYLQRDALSAGFQTRHESGYLLEIAQEYALQRRRHIWVDGSLRDGDWYEAEFKRIRRAHPDYKIAIVHVVANRAAVQRRVHSRAATTGRHVPEREIDDSIHRVPKSVRRLAPYLNFLAVIDNSAEVPHLVEYCDEAACHVCLDDWEVFSERWGCAPDGLNGEAAPADECELPPNGDGEWEELSKNFELARRTSQSGAAEDEWG